MIAIIDYGVGNLFSLRSSLEYIGQKTVVSGDAKVLAQADKIILPGVGAFGDAAEKLQRTGLVPTILEEAGAGKYMLGICLGMQLLFDKSSEYGEHAGLGLVPGQVAAIEPDLPDRTKAIEPDLPDRTKAIEPDLPDRTGHDKSEELAGGKLKVPHIGWNRLNIRRDDKIFKYVKNGEYFYYVHSYYAKQCADYTLATSDYDIPITGVVRNGSVYGTQFHPEKSGDAGLRLLKAFCEL